MTVPTSVITGALTAANDSPKKTAPAATAGRGGTVAGLGAPASPAVPAAPALPAVHLPGTSALTSLPGAVVRGLGSALSGAVPQGATGRSGPAAAGGSLGGLLSYLMGR